MKVIIELTQEDVDNGILAKIQNSLLRGVETKFHVSAETLRRKVLGERGTVGEVQNNEGQTSVRL